MIVQVFGALALVLAAFGAGLWIAYRKGHTDGWQAKITDMAELRAQRRAEAALKGHQLSPWPGDEWTERLADTGELRLAAETGDLDELARQNAAFFRVFDLATSWTRKRASA